MKAIFSVVAVTVIMGAGLMFFLSGDDGGGSPLLPGPFDELNDSSLAILAPNTDTDGEASTNGVEVSAIAALDSASTGPFSSGPYRVTSDALGDPRTPSNQQRIFRTADGTLAILYHRALPAESSTDELQEIIMIHSHDAGKNWHGDIVLGSEASGATYSGIIDSEGNIFVVYGRDAIGASGGALHLRRLQFDSSTQSWSVGPKTRVVWDWPGKGAGSPVLAFTDDRLWLAYRYFDGSSYQIIAQFADPDDGGRYSESAWSRPSPLTPSIDDSSLYVTLVSHGDKLSVFTTWSNSGIQWRELLDPQSADPAWQDESLVFSNRGEGSDIRFVAAASRNGDIHLIVSSQRVSVRHTRYDGAEWSQLTPLSSSNGYGPTLGNDGENTWAFWVQGVTSGRSQIVSKRWHENSGWESGHNIPWTEDYGSPFPSVVLYRTASDSFTDVTRYIDQLEGYREAASLNRLFERPSDMLFFRYDERFSQIQIEVLESGIGEEGDSLPFEYWNGSEWMLVPFATVAAEDNPFTKDLIGRAFHFEPPPDWQTSTLDDTTAYYIRLRGEQLNTSLSVFGFSEQIQITGLFVTGEVNPIIDLIWSECLPNDKGGVLWYGAVSNKVIETVELAKKHSHETIVSTINIPGSISQQTRALPSGVSRQYFPVTLNLSETHEFQLLDGQVRKITLIKTDLVFRSSDSVTVWSTADIEVSGPGIEPRRAKIPVAYFQSPVILNDVRIYVEITRDFLDLRLSGDFLPTGDARVMLSDARYSLTDLTQYRWPFPGMLWGETGPFNYYQGLTGSSDRQRHNSSFVQVLPGGTPVQAWHSGKFGANFSGSGWVVGIDDASDGRGFNWHQVRPINDVDLDTIGSSLSIGQQIATVVDSIEPVSLVWGSGGQYDWAPVLAEWYVAGISPVERSYIKDWLILGPYEQQSIDGMIDEPQILPEAGDLALGNRIWKRFDGIVPGVVDVAEAVSDFPNSGWAKIEGSYPFNVAYFVTYVYSPAVKRAVLNIGSSDPIDVWIKDKLVLERNSLTEVDATSDSSIVPDSRKVNVLFQSGWNRVLLKLHQGSTEFSASQRAWNFSFRISDKKGDPIASLFTDPDKDRLSEPLKYFASDFLGVK